jgi:hypothetical protein
MRKYRARKLPQKLYFIRSQEDPPTLASVTHDRKRLAPHANAPIADLMGDHRRSHCRAALL